MGGITHKPKGLNGIRGQIGNSPLADKNIPNAIPFVSSAYPPEPNADTDLVIETIVNLRNDL